MQLPELRFLRTAGWVLVGGLLGGVGCYLMLGLWLKCIALWYVGGLSPVEAMAASEPQRRAAALAGMVLGGVCGWRGKEIRWRAHAVSIVIAGLTGLLASMLCQLLAQRAGNSGRYALSHWWAIGELPDEPSLPLQPLVAMAAHAAFAAVAIGAWSVVRSASRIKQGAAHAKRRSAEAPQAPSDGGRLRRLFAPPASKWRFNLAEALMAVLLLSILVGLPLGSLRQAAHAYHERSAVIQRVQGTGVFVTVDAWHPHDNGDSGIRGLSAIISSTTEVQSVIESMDMAPNLQRVRLFFGPGQFDIGVFSGRPVRYAVHISRDGGDETLLQILQLEECDRLSISGKTLSPEAIAALESCRHLRKLALFNLPLDEQVAGMLSKVPCDEIELIVCSGTHALARDWSPSEATRELRISGIQKWPYQSLTPDEASRIWRRSPHLKFMSVDGEQFFRRQ